MQPGHTARISTTRQGQTVPFFLTPSLALPSPSPTLLVERHTLTSTDWVGQRMGAHVVTMVLEPGELLHTADGGAIERHRLAANDIIMCARSSDAHVRWSGTAESISISVDHAVVMRAAQSLTPSGRFERLPRAAREDAHLTLMMRALYQEQASDFAGGRLFMDGIEQAIAALLVTRCNSFGGKLPAQAPDLAPLHMRRVIDFIHARLDTPLSLAELAACAGLSEGHFSRQFRASFGTTPHQFVVRTRIAQAKVLLAKPHIAIIDVGLACGFPNSQHFARLFHRYVGMPPSRFRRESL